MNKVRVEVVLLQVRMRELEKATRQMEKDESRHARGLISPTGRTDSGRTTPTGRVTPPGITNGFSGSGRVTPLGTTPSGSGLTTPTGKVTPWGITSSTISNSTNRVLPADTFSSASASLAAARNPKKHIAADLSGRTSPTGRTDSGLTTPTGSVTPSGLSFVTNADYGADASLRHELSATSAASTATAEGSFRHESASAVGGDVSNTSSAAGSAHPAKLLPTKSSVKDAIAMFEGSHPPSSRLSASKSTTDQQFKSLSGAVPGKLAPSKSTVAYQTKSMAEGVYGKLYSSKSTLGQDAISASWDTEEEEASNVDRSAGVASPSGGGVNVPGSGSGVPTRAGSLSSGGIGRFGGGIGRGGSNKFAVEANHATGLAAKQTAVTPTSDG